MLYTRPDIKDQIQQLRALGDRTPNAPVPSRQRCIDASLLLRLAIANERNRDLAEENRRLRGQLEHALGQLRANRTSNLTDPSRVESKTRLAPSLFGNDRPRLNGEADLTPPR